MPDVENSAENKPTVKKEKHRAAWFWLNNTDGKPSISATFATVAFVSATFAYVASVFEKIGGVSFRSFDSAACTAYLVPILGLYFGRRYTDAKAGGNINP